jgi:hypothetical protein
MRIHDPACGTGEFLLIAHDYVSQPHELDRDQKKHLNSARTGAGMALILLRNGTRRFSVRTASGESRTRRGECVGAQGSHPPGVGLQFKSVIVE